MHTSDSIERTVFAVLCMDVDTPRSLGAYLRLQYDESQLLTLDWHPADYICPLQFENDYLIKSFLSKWKGLKTGIDTRATALGDWTVAESICLVINDLFRDYWSGQPLASPAVDDLLPKIRRKISGILGPCRVGEVMTMCRWTQGATFDLRRGSHLDKKLSQAMSVTRPARNLILAHIENDPHWFESLSGIHPWGPYSVLPSSVTLTRGSRLLTVPKSAKTDRVIAAEPTGNVFLQQGIGRFIRSRLSRFGIRLDDQSINQRLAARAIDEDLSTLDLSMASDSISRNLVLDLLPIDWVELLDRVRCYETQIEGVWVPLEKFSSMGNSFTFELETLIFYAIVKVAQEETSDRPDVVSVYGDDIIVPRESAELAIEILQALGFKVNSEKSFLTGRFFESCGRHYFDGKDVTPTYQRELTSSLQERIRLSNRLTRWAYSKANHVSLNASLLVREMDELASRYSGSRRKTRFPCIPMSDPSDDGYLAWTKSELGTEDRNHGFKCPVYIFRPWSYKSTNELPFFAYKLRRPSSFSFSDPQGQGEIGTLDGRWLLSFSMRHDYGD